MTTTIVSYSELAALVGDLVAAGTRVIAPVPIGHVGERTEYQPIQRLEEASLGGSLPGRSLKEFFRPASEAPALATFAPQVILGARPCDAAGVENLDNVMGCDYRDELWLARREATTIVSLACAGVDGACFCGAVGLGPDSTRGSDALLVPLDGVSGPLPFELAAMLGGCVDVFLHDAEPFPGAADLQARSAEPRRRPNPAIGYLALTVTPKGEALLDGLGKPLVDPADREKAGAFVSAARDRMAKNLAAVRLSSSPRRAERTLAAHTGIADFEARLGIAAADGGDLMAPVASPLSAEQWTALKHLPEWLARNFDHDLWKSLASRCRGCGKCAAICSTSPCFDIVDEHDGTEPDPGPFRRPARLGPPPTRTEHFRQRVMHKFSIYPRRFDAILCTGCGRCTRTCQAGMNLPEVLGRLVQLAGAEPRASGQ